MNFVEAFSCEQDKSNHTFTTPGAKPLAERQESDRCQQEFRLNTVAWELFPPPAHPFLPLCYCFIRITIAKTSLMRLEGLADKYSRDTTPTLHMFLPRNYTEQLIHGTIDMQPSWSPKSIKDTDRISSKNISLSVLQTGRKCKLSFHGCVTGIKNTSLQESVHNRYDWKERCKGKMVSHTQRSPSTKKKNLMQKG